MTRVTPVLHVPDVRASLAWCVLRLRELTVRDDNGFWLTLGQTPATHQRGLPR